MFNVGFDGNVRHAIDFHQGDKIAAKAFKALICALAALDTAHHPK